MNIADVFLSVDVDDSTGLLVVKNGSELVDKIRLVIDENTGELEVENYG